MTIDEAIGVDEQMLSEAERRQLPGRVSALKLSIEALKAIAAFRAGDRSQRYYKLPGETEE